jgi:hypothetical protein
VKIAYTFIPTLNKFTLSILDVQRKLLIVDINDTKNKQK